MYLIKLTYAKYQFVHPSLARICNPCLFIILLKLSPEFLTLSHLMSNGFRLCATVKIKMESLSEHSI